MTRHFYYLWLLLALYAGASVLAPTESFALETRCSEEEAAAGEDCGNDDDNDGLDEIEREDAEAYFEGQEAREDESGTDGSGEDAGDAASSSGSDDSGSDDSEEKTCTTTKTCWDEVVDSHDICLRFGGYCAAFAWIPGVGNSCAATVITCLAWNTVVTVVTECREEETCQ